MRPTLLGVESTHQFEFFAHSPAEVDGLAVDVFDSDQCATVGDQDQDQEPGLQDQCATIRADLSEQLTNVDVRV